MKKLEQLKETPFRLKREIQAMYHFVIKSADYDPKIVGLVQAMARRLGG